MDKKTLFEKFGVYDYNSFCVVREPDDRDDIESQSALSLLLTNTTVFGTAPSLVVDDTTESEENDESNDLSYMNLGDSFKLMLGLMVKSEKYFTQYEDRSAEDANFKEKVLLIKECLIKNSKHFGCKVTQNTTGVLLIQDDNTDNSNKVDIKGASEKCYSQQKKKNNSKNAPQQGTKRKSCSKDDRNQNLNPVTPGSSKKQRDSYVFYDKRLINTAAKSRCSRTRENFQIVVNDLKEETLSKAQSNGRIKNRKLSKSFHFDKRAMTNRNVSRRSMSMSGLSGLSKRSLFQPTKWLQTFHHSYCPPE